MGKKKIIYISGEGHSGSTLLDIVLGSQQNSFSAGELRFLPDKGIRKGQFCSCGLPVPNCEVWEQVVNQWEELRKLPLDKYIELQSVLLSNRKFYKAANLIKKKPQVIQDFLKDTDYLYKIICEVTDSECIIDSSKAPGMIPILKELDFEITVVHLTRRFGHVLNSNKRPPKKKDLKAGIEHDMVPSKTFTVLRSWYLKNFLTRKYAKDTIYKKVRYEEYIYDLKETISKVSGFENDFIKLLENRGPFTPKHLVAGNAMRMNKEIYVSQSPKNTNYERLGWGDRLIARTIDYFY